MGNITTGTHLGWHWNGASWTKFGLSDTGNLQITGGSTSGSGNSATWTDGAGDLQLKNGLGIDIQSTGTLNVNSGDTTLGGSLSVTGGTTITDNLVVKADNKVFSIKTSGNSVKFEVDTDNGNTTCAGNLTVDGSVTLGDANSDNVTFNADVNSNILPNANNTYNLGSSGQKWAAVYASSFTATTFTGNLTGDVTGNVTGNAGGSSSSCTGNALTATTLQTARNIGGVSFNGGADINLPGVNTAGNQDTSGTATNADNINVDEANSNTNWQVLFSAQNSAGYQRPHIDTDDSHLIYNPSTNTLGGCNLAGNNITASSFGNANQNAYGTRTVSTNNPSGGSDGDIWYKY